MRARRPLSALAAGAAIAAAVAVSGCGVTKTVSGFVDPVAKAADVTATAPGYRIAATMTVGLGSTGQTAHATMSGVMDRADKQASITVHETAAGHSATTTEKVSGTTIYMNAAQLGGSGKVPGGKPWIKYDLTQATEAMGMGGLSTSSDPSQFVDYLRAAGGTATRVGTQTIRGVPTTHYHVVVSFDRYLTIVRPAARAATARSVSLLESMLGSHTMQMDAWIDSKRMVRRMSFSLAECVENQHLNIGMMMDLYDYGPQPRPALPSASETYDITPQVDKVLKNVKLSCGSSS